MAQYHKIRFTLIELLVVIAIISILLTILLPGLKKAKETAHRIDCAGNLKQIGSVYHMYTQDCDGWAPLAYYDAEDISWRRLFCDYLNIDDDYVYNNPETGEARDAIKIFRCPADRSFYTSSYKINGGQRNKCHEMLDGAESVRIAQISNPSIIMAFIDFTYYPELKDELIDNYPKMAMRKADTYTFWDDYPSQISKGRYNMHGNGVNICFVDGHVTYKKDFIERKHWDWK